MEIESLRAEIVKVKKESVKAKKARMQAQADAEEQQQAATKRKRVGEEVLDEPVTKKVKPFLFLQKVQPTFVTDPDSR